MTFELQQNPLQSVLLNIEKLPVPPFVTDQFSESVFSYAVFSIYLHKFLKSTKKEVFPGIFAEICIFFYTNSSKP